MNCKLLPWIGLGLYHLAQPETPAPFQTLHFSTFQNQIIHNGTSATGTLSPLVPPPEMLPLAWIVLLTLSSFKTRLRCPGPQEYDRVGWSGALPPTRIVWTGRDMGRRQGLITWKPSVYRSDIP